MRYFPKVKPKGSLKTVEEVQACLGGLLYSVCGSYPSVYTYDLSEEEYILAFGNDHGDLALFKKSRYEVDISGIGCEFFLSDYNIGANYNSNFLFANEEDAQEFCDFCNTDTEWQEARENWNEECRIWDELAGDYELD